MTKSNPQTANFIDLINEKNHVIKFVVPPVKLFGLTIRKGYTATQFVKCECGESARERLIKSMNKPNELYQKMTGRI